MNMILSRRTLVIAVAILIVPVLWLLTRTPDSPADASRLETDNCVHPCWRGIRPGMTTLDEAEAILREDDTLEVTKNISSICGQPQNSPFWQICVDGSTADTPVTRMNWILPISGENTVSLRDTIAAFGEPFAAKICGRVDTWHSVILFNGNRVVIAYVGSVMMNEPRRFAPDQRVEQVLYYAHVDAMPPLYVQDALPWRGFGEPAEQPVCRI